MDAHAIAEAAYDMAYEKRSRDEWMVGLTSDEIDSIRLGMKEKPFIVKMHNFSEEANGNKQERNNNQ